MKKQRTKEEQEKRDDRRLTIKATVIVLSLIAVGVPVMWYIMDWLATESVITYQHVQIDNRDITVTLSEKTNSGTTNRVGSNNMHHDDLDRGPSHYGYFLELYDSAANQSLHKLKFDSPVHTIQSTPQLRIINDSIIWIISTTNSVDDDERGFMLKFAIQNNQVVEQNFKLDELYRIRKLDDYKVVISEGYDIFGDYIDPIYGGLYFDLEIEKIVDTRHELEDPEPTNPEDFMPQ